MTSKTAALTNFQLRLARPPSIRTIANSRLFIQDLCEPIVGVDASSQVAMVAHELLENLTKYAGDGPVRLEVEVQSHQDRHQVKITSTNQASTERLAELQLILEEISETREPRATYLRYMADSVAKVEGSRLGLARIRAEGEMEIQYTLHGNEITICAQASFYSGIC